MIDRLHVMGIQRWQQRNVTAGQTLQTIETTSNKNEKIYTKANNAVSENLSAYAASSLRLDSQGQQSRWLWVLPQFSLNAEELKLIDNMVAATGSQWEFTSIADTYLDTESLNKTLSQDLSAMIFLAQEVSWAAFEQHSLFSEKQYIYIDSAKNLIAHPERKRLAWQALQTLMI